jgi:hypothetical protein
MEPARIQPHPVEGKTVQITIPASVLRAADGARRSRHWIVLGLAAALVLPRLGGRSDHRPAIGWSPNGYVVGRGTGSGYGGPIPATGGSPNAWLAGNVAAQEQWNRVGSDATRFQRNIQARADEAYAVREAQLAESAAQNAVGQAQSTVESGGGVSSTDWSSGSSSWSGSDSSE